MKISPNISIISALIRITIGLTVLSWSTAKLVKRPWRDSFLIISMLGAMKVAEGIVRFCPVTYFYEKCQQQKGQQSDGARESRDSMEGLNQESVLPYSPT